MSDSKPIKIKDASGEILASYSLEDRDRAFEYAQTLEEMGLDISIVEPSLPESLILSLGANDQDTEILRREIDQEIDEHNHPTCQNAPPTKTIH